MIGITSLYVVVSATTKKERERETREKNERTNEARRRKREKTNERKSQCVRAVSVSVETRESGVELSVCARV